MQAHFAAFHFLAEARLLVLGGLGRAEAEIHNQ